WLCWKLYPDAVSNAGSCEPGNPHHEQSAGHHAGRGWIEILDRFLCTSWLRRLGWTLLCSALWVALEMILGRLFTGFPWIYLGASQYRILQVIQLASVTGVYGVSFLLVWFAVCLASAFAVLIRRPQIRWHAQRELLAPFLVAAAVVGMGWQE